MTIRIPAEWEPHACCWMAWAVHREWGKAVNKVKRELREVVQTIARYEPARLLAPHGGAAREARRECSTCSNVTVIEAPVDDIWMRDIAPSFALSGRGARQEVVAIDWNFNAWGATQAQRQRPGDRLAKTATSIFGVPRIEAAFVSEGGAFETPMAGARSSRHEAACSIRAAIPCAAETRSARDCSCIFRQADRLPREYSLDALDLWPKMGQSYWPIEHRIG